MMAVRDVYGEVLKELSTTNKNIVVLDADLSGSTKTCEFAEVAPERFFNMGISEQDMMGTAAGLAVSGKIAFASSFAIFATGRCYDQIRNTIAYSNLNVKIVATHAGLNVGEDGGSHQALEDIALMRVLPNMEVFSPADEVETREVIKYIATTNKPTYVRLARIKSEKVFNSMEYEFEPYKGVEICDGKDVTVFTTGIITSHVVEANKILKEKGISAQIVNIHCIKPIDKEMIVSSAKKTGKVVTVEEHNIIGGFGSAVCEVLSEQYPVKVLRIGVNDRFGKSGESLELFKLYELDPQSIAKKIEEFVKND